MSPANDWYRSPFVDVLQLPAQRARLEALLKHYDGGAILQIGLTQPEALIEAARRGAPVTGLDKDPGLAARARELAATAGLQNGLDRHAFIHGTAGPGCDALRPFETKKASVAFAERLPDGAACTVLLEQLARCARTIILPAAAGDAIPDRFLQNSTVDESPDYIFLHMDRAAGNPIEFRARLISDDTETNPAFLAACEVQARVLEEASSKQGPLLSVVRDCGFDARRADCGMLSTREPDANCSVVNTATSTDRFSREHLTTFGSLDEIWVPGATQRNAVIQAGIDPTRVRIVRDAVDIYQFQPKPKTSQQFRVCAMASSMYRMEEVALAAKAFAKAFGSDNSVALVILCGPDVDANDVTIAVTGATEGLDAANIQIEDSMAHEDMPEFYTDFDLFLRPTSGEAHGTAILEAMACGIPVAATRFGLAAELVTLQNGYPIEFDGFQLCDPGDHVMPANHAGARRPVVSVESVAAALQSAHGDWEGRLTRSGAAREYVVQHHSIESVAAALRVMHWESLQQDTPAMAETKSQNQKPAADLPSTLEEAAAAAGGNIMIDRGDSLAPTIAQLETALTSRELWCLSRISFEGWVAAGLPGNRVHMAPPVVNVDTFSPRARPSVLPTRRRNRILADARRDFGSGVDLALTAFANAQIQNSAFIVMGARPEARAALEKLAAASGHGIEVVFVAEPASDMARASLMTACDLIIDLSRGPSDGQFVLEAAACGRPAVSVAFTQPAGLVSNSTGYPVPAKMKIAPVAFDTFASAPIFSNANCDEAGSLIARAFSDTAGRKRRGDAARAMALAFTPARLAEFAKERARAILPHDEMILACAVPADCAAPELPADTHYIYYSATPEHGGNAEDAGEQLCNIPCDLILIASGEMKVEQPRGGEWARPLVEPLAQDRSVSLTIARDANGVILAMRPSILRNASFPQGFESGAFLLEFAREMIRRGEKVVPVSQLNIQFVPSGRTYAREASAVEQFTKAEDELLAGHAESGLDLLHQVIETFPRYRAPIDCAADVFEQLGSTSEALNARIASTRLAPRDAAARGRLGMYYLKLGDATAALKHLNIARAFAPDHSQLTLACARAEARLGRTARAAETYFEVLGMEPECAEAALECAQVLQQIGKAADAIDLLKAYSNTPAAAPEAHLVNA